MNTIRNSLQRLVRPLAAALLALSLSAALPPTQAWAASAAVDVNRASQAELETIKGIGPSLSGKILAAREKGAFKDWADLQQRVSGVGPGNSAKFAQAGMTVGGATLSANAADMAAQPKSHGKGGHASVAKAEKAARAKP